MRGRRCHYLWLVGAVLPAIVLWTAQFAALAGPLEDADAAERRDDCATAIPIYRSLAARGDIAAENRLGYFYQIGWGVKRDWLEAGKCTSRLRMLAIKMRLPH
jgi:hypothetical protein